MTFAVATTATSSPFVSLNCYQGGVWVYTASAGFFAAYPCSRNFTALVDRLDERRGGLHRAALLDQDRHQTTTLATASFHVLP